MIRELARKMVHSAAGPDRLRPERPPLKSLTLAMTLEHVVAAGPGRAAHLRGLHSLACMGS